MTPYQSHLSISAIIQARMGSTRLPGKVLKQVLGKPLLQWIIERLQRCKYLNSIVVATTTLPEDNPIEALALSESVECFRGDSEDVLSRYIGAMRRFGTDIGVRITGDCPLIDPSIVDEAIQLFLDPSSHFDYVSNCVKRTYPRGLDVEVFSFEALEQANRSANTKEEREHVTYYIVTHPTLFNMGSMEQKEDLSSLRLTVDTEEDFLLVSKIIEGLAEKHPHFGLPEIVTLLSNHPEWLAINAHIQQKKV
ncbi:cytidylyltransferase domain-containing protein [Estrella lausannensis]|nr:glycosyltransferase family protein [Estrella lausannensis]